MIDPNQMSETELELLKEVAKSKGQTLEEALVGLGHIVAAEEDATVSLEGTSQTAEPSPADEDVPAFMSSDPLAVEPPIEVEKPVEAEEETDELHIEVESDFEPPPPPAAEDDDPPPDDDDDDESVGGSIKQICVQCGWDQDVQTIPDPDGKDKISFLQSILGHKVFSKKYTMFGGNLRITFRTLAIREIDILYQAAFQAQKEERILTTTDYYEYLNRLRLYLQLTSFSSKTTSLQIKLPEGLSRDTHEGCNSYWDEFLKKEGILDEEQPLIQQVSDYVIDRVMKTEHLQRTITHECSKFNRLVAKLEASVDSPDFWNETEQPS